MAEAVWTDTGDGMKALNSTLDNGWLGIGSIVSLLVLLSTSDIAFTIAFRLSSLRLTSWCMVGGMDMKMLPKQALEVQSER